MALPTSSMSFPAKNRSLNKNEGRSSQSETIEGDRVAALDASEMGTFKWNMLTGYIEWDSGHEKLWGYATGEFDGTFEGFANKVHPDDLAEVQKKIEFCLEKRLRWQKEFRIIRDGEIKWIVSSGDFEYDAEGEPLFLRGVVVESTHRKEIEIRLGEDFRQAQKMEAVGRLAGGVAHDFNNLLTVIGGYGSLISSEDGVSENVASASQEILEATERAANLTRQLLAFGRKQVMQPKKVNINQRFRETLSMLKRIVGEDIAIVLDLGSTDLHAFADSVMFDQMIMNLVVNSRDAMEIGRGEIRISAGKVDDEEGADHIFVEVSDNGSGIPQDALDLIFDPFFTTKEQGRGTGLGLATVFGIVEQHNGEILVDSHVGKGTSFRILLPKLDCEKNESVEREAVRNSAGCSGTILLAEDESSVRKLIQIILTREGYQVIEAENGGEAVEIWNQEKDQIDLLLTDIVMPGGLNGFELASQLRDEAPDLNVAFMSGYSADVAGRELNLEEGQIFIQKPASREELLSSVRESLGNSTSQVGLAN